MPAAHGGVAAAVLAGEIPVFGGEARSGAFDKVEADNPEADNWREYTPMPTPLLLVVDARDHLTAADAARAAGPARGRRPRFR